ncbi:MAG: hypothetical protein ACOYMA_04725 [Bacteroidia bacterium]
MNQKYILTGGASIGNANATYPFADLFVDKDVLKINASIIGNLVFQSKDVISIDSYTNGIRINHCVENYNSKIIFWTTKNPDIVINEIEKTGFLDNKSISENYDVSVILRRQKEGSFPIKKTVAIIFGIIWNLLFLYDFIPFFLNLNNKSDRLPIGIGITSAVGFLFVCSILALFSKHFRNIILKESRDLNDIRKFTYLIALVSGIILATITIVKNLIE